VSIDPPLLIQTEPFPGKVPPGKKLVYRNCSSCSEKGGILEVDIPAVNPGKIRIPEPRTTPTYRAITCGNRSTPLVFRESCTLFSYPPSKNSTSPALWLHEIKRGCNIMCNLKPEFRKE